MGAAYMRGFQGPDFGGRQRLDDDQALPRRRPAEGRRGPALRLRPRAGLPGRAVRRAPGAVQGAPGGRDAADDAVLRDAGRAAEGIAEVGFGFNKPVLDLLRDELGFDGIICTDWGLVTDAEMFGQPFPARAWGVEHLSLEDRVALILDAGADQLGGEACPELVVELVRERRGSTEARIDASVRRLLRGEVPARAVRRAPLRRRRRGSAGRRLRRVPRRRGIAAQAAAVTVLTNARAHPAAGSPALRIYAEGLPSRHGGDDPAEADVAILRLQAPYEQRGPGFEAFFHAGSLDFPARRRSTRIAAIAAQVPTILDVYLDRPAILTPLVDAGRRGRRELRRRRRPPARRAPAARPAGRLPFDLPRSMAAVEASRADVPFDTADPLFRFGHGLPVV